MIGSTGLLFTKTDADWIERLAAVSTGISEAQAGLLPEIQRHGLLDDPDVEDWLELNWLAVRDIHAMCSRVMGGKVKISTLPEWVDLQRRRVAESQELLTAIDLKIEAAKAAAGGETAVVEQAAEAPPEPAEAVAQRDAGTTN